MGYSISRTCTVAIKTLTDLKQKSNLARVLQDQADAYWEFHLREHPVVALEHGDTRYRRELFRQSVDDFSRQDKGRAKLLHKLAKVDVNVLAGQDRFTFQLLQRELEADREHFAFKTHLRPMIFPFGPEGWVADAVHKTSLFNKADAGDYLARMATVPSFLKDHSERLWLGLDQGFRLPRVLLERICKAAESYLEAPPEKSVWLGPFARASATGRIFDAEKTVMKSLIENEIRPAYRTWVDMLRNEYASYCRDSIATSEEPDGDAYYRFLVRYYTSSDLTPDTIHIKGCEEVARIADAMSAIASANGYPDDLVGFRSFLANDDQFYESSGQRVLEQIEILCKRIDRKIPEFFGRLPRMTYGVESVPEGLAAHVPPAYAQPNPPNGTSSGIYWVTSLPERCPSYLHVPLTLHEAWPGHLMHIALMQEMQELPAFRRYGLANYTAYIEGWGLYCEQLGHDFGFYSDPYAHYGCLEMEMWRAARLVVDTGIHMKGWSREKAVSYMTANLSLDYATIEAEVDRYIGMPGQALAYKVGEFKFKELRNRASRDMGQSFNLRGLHDRFLNAGPVTLDLLDEHVQGWIDSVHQNTHGATV